MRVETTLAIGILALLLTACGSSQPQSERRRMPVKYEHTFEFMWEEVQAELRKSWYVEETNELERMVTTRWEERLAPMGHQGRRHRIKVYVMGADGSGYVVDAVQESQQNTNDRNPLSSADAEWSGTSSDGALADKFLIGLARRLYPSLEWKSEMIR